jgi:TusA-related sulfurtransferase
LRVVDGTAKTCKGVIAGLEKAFEDLADGTGIMAIVGDVPSRIDVRAWAERKGHLVQSDVRSGAISRMVIVKGRGLVHNPGPYPRP